MRFLTETYQTGQTPLREALNRLTADGLVECREQRGFYVAGISRNELVELTKTRCWVESLALRESMVASTPQWEEQLLLAEGRSVGTTISPHVRSWEERIRIDPDAREAQMVQLLAQELRANPGNWQETSGSGNVLPATLFTAARQLAYRASQDNRHGLADDQYQGFFDAGKIGPALAEELIRRYNAKRQVGHWAPDVGPLTE